MTGEFSVGTVCKGRKFRHWTEYNGMECVVVERLAPTQGHDPREVGEPNMLTLTYGVAWADGKKIYVRPENLERRLRSSPGGPERRVSQGIAGQIDDKLTIISKTLWSATEA